MNFFVFSKGIQQKIDSRLVGSPHLLTAENCIFQKSGSVQKRKGYEQIGSLGTSITDLTDFDNSIIAQTSNLVYTFSEELQQFYQIGAKLPHKLTHVEIVRDNYSNKNPDVAETASIFISAWETTKGGGDVRYSVTSQAGITVVHDALVAEDAQLPKVVILDTFVWIVYQDTSDNSLKTRRVNTGTPSILEAEVELVPTADIAAGANWSMDSITELSAIILAYEDTEGAPGITAKYFNNLVEAGNGISNNGFPAKTQLVSSTSSGTLKIDSGVDSNTDTSHLLIWDDGTDVKYLIADFALAVTTTSTNWQAATSISRCATYWDSTRWVIMTQVDGGSVNLNLIYKGILTSGGTITTAAAVYQRGLTLISNPSSPTAGTISWWVLHESLIQPTYFLFEDTIEGALATKVSKHLQGNAGTTHSVNHLGTSSFAVGLNKRNKFILENGIIFKNEGVVLVDVATNVETRSHIARLGRTSVITGSLLQTFDKHAMSEHGFDIFPEDLSAAQSGAAGLADGVYQWVATYEWTDANGDTHESAPSAAVSFTVTGGPRNVTITVPTNRVTTKTDVIVNLYRTTESGSLFYKASGSATGFNFNDRTADTIDIVDTTTDAVLTGNPKLYTEGGALENIAPPPSSLAITHKGRVFLAGDPEFRNRVSYSHTYIDGEGLQFNDTLGIDIEENTDNTTGLSAFAILDDSVIVFKRNSIFVIRGQGPSRNGQGNDFSPQRITTDVGCDDPFSIVSETPLGVFFKSAKGIYLLNRQLETKYVGQGVEDFNASSVLSSSLHADENHVKFVLDTGEILYYNYFHDAWSVWTKYNATASARRRSDDKFFHATAEGKIFSSTNDYRDNNAPIRMKIRTGWITMGAQHLTKRIKVASLLGDRLEDHRITWNIYLDYSDVITDTRVFDVRSNDAMYGSPGTSWGAGSPYGLDSNSWGSENSWGSGDFWGGNSNDVMEYRHKLKIQKCRAISFEFTDESIGGVSGPSFTFVGVGIDAQMKKGIKLKTSRTI